MWTFGVLPPWWLLLNSLLLFLKITTAHFQHKWGVRGVYYLILVMPHPSLVLCRIVEEVVRGSCLSQCFLLLKMVPSINPNVIFCVCLVHRLILEKEGPRSLFRGLGPNLVGVAPSRWAFAYHFWLLGGRTNTTLVAFNLVLICIVLT